MSVTVSSLLRLTKPLKYGITEPLELSTLPYLTTEKTVLTCAERIFEEIYNLSETSFVDQYKFTGLDALSVDKAITFLTLLLIEQSIKF